MNELYLINGRVQNDSIPRSRGGMREVDGYINYKYYTINDTWQSEDRRKLLAYARDVLNSDYGGHRLTFQLFAQSAPFAQSAAVYRNFDWNATLDFVKKSAGLSDKVLDKTSSHNGDPAIKKWYENNFDKAAE